MQPCTGWDVRKGRFNTTYFRWLMQRLLLFLGWHLHIFQHHLFQMADATPNAPTISFAKFQHHLFQMADATSPENGRFRLRNLSTPSISDGWCNSGGSAVRELMPSFNTTYFRWLMQQICNYWYKYDPFNTTYFRWLMQPSSTSEPSPACFNTTYFRWLMQQYGLVGSLHAKRFNTTYFRWLMQLYYHNTLQNNK